MTLRATGLCARVHGADVLRGVDLELPAKRVLALLGRNGMGKTTTLRTIMGLTEHTAGELTLGGDSLRGVPTYRRARMGLFYVPEDGGIFQQLTVHENLRLAARSPLDEAFATFPELLPLRTRRAGLLSGGERKMLALARAIISGASWFLIDEPSLGLAPAVVRRLEGAILALRERGGVLLVEQNLGFAERVAEHYVLLLQGRSVESGPITGLRGSEGFDSALLIGPGNPGRDPSQEVPQ